ncbi:MAG TPA: DoxX family protein [Pirellulaceae bacterium]|jgi:uncharacterized membrane protein YphA (DoxX/SURF4 family)
MKLMNGLIKRLIKPPVDGPAATMWLRMMCGSVFFWEGVLKFIYLNQGVGRFTKLGLPFPGATADFVAVLEIVGGIMLLLGLGTRLIAIPFVIEMLVAIAVTKIPLFLGTSPLPPPPALPIAGFWAVLHEVRSEFAQLLTVVFLFIAGPGRWSLDALMARRSPNVARVRRPLYSSDGGKVTAG